MMFREGPKLRAYGFPNTFSCVNGVEDWKVLILIERGIKIECVQCELDCKICFAHIVFIVFYEVKWFPWVCKCLLLYYNLQHVWDICPPRLLSINVTFSIWQVGIYQNLDFPLQIVARGWVGAHAETYIFYGRLRCNSTWQILVYTILVFYRNLLHLGGWQELKYWFLIVDYSIQEVEGTSCTGCQPGYAHHNIMFL